MISCTLSDGSTKVYTALFNVFVNYACDLTNSYNTYSVAPIIL